jgi:hypothetical protein
VLVMRAAALVAVILLGCSAPTPLPQASSGASSGGCETLPVAERECVGKCPIDLCDGDAGEPIYRVCDKDGTCRFPAFTCEASRPGAPCEGGRCTTPIKDCDGSPCVAVSFCCTGCLDASGGCRGEAGALGGKPCPN